MSPTRANRIRPYQVRDTAALVAVAPDRNLLLLKFMPHLIVYMATYTTIRWLCDLGHT
jgi:hypothetical protein